jgi:hypothetical protein
MFIEERQKAELRLQYLASIIQRDLSQELFSFMPDDITASFDKAPNFILKLEKPEYLTELLEWVNKRDVPANDIFSVLIKNKKFLSSNQIINLKSLIDLYNSKVENSSYITVKNTISSANLNFNDLDKEDEEDEKIAKELLLSISSPPSKTQDNDSAYHIEKQPIYGSFTATENSKKEEKAKLRCCNCF